MKELAKIIIALLIILISFISFDFIFGKFASKILIKGKSKQEYILNERNDADIVFFGSSRANHHYDSQYICDSLGIKALNAGEDGRGLTYQLPLIKNYLERNIPDLIVLEVFPSLEGSWNDRISLLYPYVDDNPNILETAKLIDPNNGIYLRSKLFQHNSNIVSEMKNLINPFNPQKTYGFEPLQPANRGIRFSLDTIQKNIDRIELDALREILQTAKNHNVEIIGVISPLYINQRPIIQSDSLFNLFGFHFIDNTMLRFKGAPETYFNDNSHLNSIGAREYTKYFMYQVKDSLNLFHNYR